MEQLNNTFREEYKEKKEDIRWEIAWQIFDEINKFHGLDNLYEVDLHELDVEEA